MKDAVSPPRLWTGKYICSWVNFINGKSKMPKKGKQRRSKSQKVQFGVSARGAMTGGGNAKKSSFNRWMKYGFKTKQLPVKVFVEWTYGKVQYTDHKSYPKRIAEIADTPCDVDPRADQALLLSL